MPTVRQSAELASWFAVVKAYLECERRYSAMMNEFSLTIPQFDVLSAIDALGEEALPSSIADRLLVTKANVTGLLKRLQDRQLVSTCNHPSDRRAMLCKLTALGQVRFAAARAASARFIQAQLAPYSEDSLNELGALMTHMQEHLHAMDPKAIARAPTFDQAKP